jgi:hypothetical protein
VRMGAFGRTFGDMGSFLYFLPRIDGRFWRMWLDGLMNLNDRSIGKLDCSDTTVREETVTGCY